MKSFLTAAALLALCVSLAGCGGLRFAPSQTIRENAAVATAAAERLEVLAETQTTVTPAMQGLAEAAATGTRAAQSYIGLPDDTEALETVRQLQSDDTAQRAAAQAKVESTAAAAAAEGAKRPKAADVIEVGSNIFDALLDSAALWAPLLGLSAAGLEALRRRKNAWKDALTATVENIEKLKPVMPAAFYSLQSSELDKAQKDLVTWAGGTGSAAKSAADLAAAQTAAAPTTPKP